MCKEMYWHCEAFEALEKVIESMLFLEHLS